MALVNHIDSMFIQSRTDNQASLNLAVSTFLFHLSIVTPFPRMKPITYGPASQIKSATWPRWIVNRPSRCFLWLNSLVDYHTLGHRLWHYIRLQRLDPSSQASAQATIWNIRIGLPPCRNSHAFDRDDTGRTGEDQWVSCIHPRKATFAKLRNFSMA